MNCKIINWQTRQIMKLDGTSQDQCSKYSKSPISPAKKRTRDAKGLFNNKTDCFFCGVTIQLESSDYSNVKIDTFADSILKCCDNRSNDCVKDRIEYF